MNPASYRTALLCEWEMRDLNPRDPKAPDLQSGTLAIYVLISREFPDQPSGINLRAVPGNVYYLFLSAEK
jgi:hypothetical protein